MYRRKRDQRDTFSKESFAVIFKGIEESMRMLGGVVSAPTTYLYCWGKILIPMCELKLMTTKQ